MTSAAKSSNDEKRQRRKRQVRSLAGIEYHGVAGSSQDCQQAVMRLLQGGASAAPEIPTIDEAGLPGFYVTFWTGLWAPKGTPKDVIAKLNSAAVTALADPTVRTGFADLAFEIFPRDQQTPEALAAYQKAETAVDLGGRVWLGGKPCKGWPAAPAFGG